MGTAKDLMMELAEGWWLLPMNHILKCPGDAFNHLSEDKKELLRQLKSDDLKNVRWPPNWIP